MRRLLLGPCLGMLALSPAGCGDSSTPTGHRGARGRTTPGPHPTVNSTASPPPGAPAPAIGARASSADPASAGAISVYANTGRRRLSPALRHLRERIYVPNSISNTVDVISARTYKVVAHYAVGAQPQHVTPSWDLRTLYVDNDKGNSLTPVSPRTGRPRGRPIPVADPYNMYFTPSGRYAIVVAEQLQRLDFRDARTFRLHHSLKVACKGVDHMDFSADGRYLYASCEFAGTMIKVDVARERVVGRLRLGSGRGAPQDVRLSPTGRYLYVADMINGGVWEVDAARFRVVRFLRTGAGTHGLYPARDGRQLYITNRGEGTISVLSFDRRRVIRKWRLPAGASPDMGGVSASGAVLWLTGRYSAEVYAIATRSGHLIARIKVGLGPHGLCVWPQPGRYSLGHTGNMR